MNIKPWMYQRCFRSLRGSFNGKRSIALFYIGIFVTGLGLIVLTKKLRFQRMRYESRDADTVRHRAYHISDDDDRFKVLKLHENGEWDHSFFFDSINGSNLADNQLQQLRSLYTPLELDWILLGRNMPPDWGEACNQYRDDQAQGQMYTSHLGNQCGCMIQGFRPSHSVWISERERERGIEKERGRGKMGERPKDMNAASKNNDGNYESDNNSILNDEDVSSSPSARPHPLDENHDDRSSFILSPTLTLVEKLARENHTLCFMGDSIDLQFYIALQNNLRRVNLLLDAYPNNTLSNQHPMTLKVFVENRKVPLNYTNDTGYSFYAKTAWRYVDHIEETSVVLEYDDGVTRLDTKVFYIKMYGWAPGHTSFMDDCTIVVANLGLHYDAVTGSLANPPFEGSSLLNDFRGVIAYLADFAAPSASSYHDGINRRIAIWRSALPQHFDTPDGHYKPNSECSLSPRKLNRSNDTPIQLYNRMYDDAFSEFCNATTSTLNFNTYEQRCTVNRTSLEYPTVFEYYMHGTHVDVMYGGSGRCCEERLERFRRVNPIVTGSILRWNVADLFDVPSWHAGPDDCSHFCYVPSLYEAAFERLLLLLPPSP